MASSGRKLLIVDDDPWVAKLVEFVGRDLGFDPVIARDGAQALERFADALPDAVVVDVVLPRVDGLEVSRRIKATGLGAVTSVLVVSGVFKAAQEAIQKYGADAVEQKPLAPEVLESHLRAFFPPITDGEMETDADTAVREVRAGETSLSTEPLAITLARLHVGRRTGVLTIRRGSRTGVRTLEVLVQEGRPVLVRGDAGQESIPALLERRGRLTPAQRAHVETLVAGAESADAGEIAVREGLVAAEDLAKLVAANQSRLLLDAFQWQHGLASFEACALPSGTKPTSRLDAPSLLHAGLRRLAWEFRDPATLVNLDAPLARTPQADAVLALLPLNAAEKWLLARVLGTASLEDVLDDLPSELAVDAVKHAALILAGAGVIQTLSKVEHPVPEVAARLDEAPPRMLTGPAADVVLSLWAERATGILQLTCPAASWMLHFRDGKLVMAGQGDGEPLERLLLTRSRISEDVAARARALVDSEPAEVLRSIGEALVETGAVSAQQLNQFVRAEVRAVLRELVLLDETSARFVPRLVERELWRHGWDAGQAVADAVRSQELALVRAVLPAASAVLQRISGAETLASHLPLTPYERNLYNLLVVPRARERLPAMEGVSQEGHERAIFVLLVMGLVEAAGGVKRRRRAAEALASAAAEARHVETKPVESMQVETKRAEDREKAGEKSEPLQVDVSIDTGDFSDFDAVAAGIEAASALGDIFSVEPSDESPREYASALPLVEQTEPLASGRQLSAEAGGRGASDARPDSVPPIEQAAGPAIDWTTKPTTEPTTEPTTDRRDMVPRAMYEALLEEKREIEQRLLALLDTQRDVEVIPRAALEEWQAEKLELRRQVASLLDELIRLKRAAGFESTAASRRGNGVEGATITAGALEKGSDGDAISELDDLEGAVISFKRTRPPPVRRK